MSAPDDAELNRLLSDDVLSVHDKEDVLAAVLQSTAAEPAPRVAWWRTWAFAGMGGAVMAAAAVLVVINTADAPSDGFTARGAAITTVDAACNDVQARARVGQVDACLPCAAGALSFRIKPAAPGRFVYASLAVPQSDWYVVQGPGPAVGEKGLALAVDAVGPFAPQRAPLNMDLRVVVSESALSADGVKAQLEPGVALPAGAELIELALRPQGQCP